jgi:hypothetical protein
MMLAMETVLHEALLRIKGLFIIKINDTAAAVNRFLPELYIIRYIGRRNSVKVTESVVLPEQP